MSECARVKQEMQLGPDSGYFRMYLDSDHSFQARARKIQKFWQGWGRPMYFFFSRGILVLPKIQCTRIKITDIRASALINDVILGNSLSLNFFI